MLIIWFWLGTSMFFLPWKQKHNLIFVLKSIFLTAFPPLSSPQEKQLFYFLIATDANYIIQSIAGLHQRREVQKHKLQYKYVYK